MSSSTLLSVFAIALSALALAWQVVAWRRGGHFVKVALSEKRWPYEYNRRPGITVRVMNVGRLPVTVEAVSFARYRKSHKAYGCESYDGSALPFRLDPGSSASWTFTREDVSQALRRVMTLDPVQNDKLWAFVLLGTGELVYVRWRLPKLRLKPESWLSYWWHMPLYWWHKAKRGVASWIFDRLDRLLRKPRP